jgi:hypothetical protein
MKPANRFARVDGPTVGVAAGPVPALTSADLSLTPDRPTRADGRAAGMRRGVVHGGGALVHAMAFIAW